MSHTFRITVSLTDEQFKAAKRIAKEIYDEDFRTYLTKEAQSALDYEIVRRSEELS